MENSKYGIEYSENINCRDTEKALVKGLLRVFSFLNSERNVY